MAQHVQPVNQRTQLQACNQDNVDSHCSTGLGWVQEQQSQQRPADYIHSEYQSEQN